MPLLLVMVQVSQGYIMRNYLIKKKKSVPQRYLFNFLVSSKEFSISIINILNNFREDVTVTLYKTNKY